MPEGPSILYLRNQLLSFKGKIVKEAGGYGPMPKGWIRGQKLAEIKTWGKHLLFLFPNGTVRVHLGLFGDVLINERKKVNRSFYLEFATGEINGYVVKAEKLANSPDEVYDWRTDVLSEAFDPAYIKGLLKSQGAKTIGDVLMDQKIFSGVGNILRNEILYRAGIHPLSTTDKIPAIKMTRLVKEAAKYAQLFYHELATNKKHTFAIYRQEYAPDGSAVTVMILPKSKRKVFFSEYKQKLYQ
jgi:endonuclease-8